MVKIPATNAEDSICGFNSLLGKIPWRRKWQPTLVFLPGESHGQRRLAGYSAWGHKKSETAEQLSTAHTYKVYSYFLSNWSFMPYFVIIFVIEIANTFHIIGKKVCFSFIPPSSLGCICVCVCVYVC